MKLSHLVIVLSTFLAASAQPSLAQSATTNETDKTVITLAADAFKEVPQDRVILTLTKEARGNDPKALADEVNKAINQVMESGKGNQQLQLQSGAYNLWPQPDYDDNGKRTAKVTYVVNGEVIVSSKDMVEATRFVEQVSEQMNLSNIAFEMSREVRQEVENEIRAAAIQAFQAKARAITREFGFDNYDIKNVRLEDSSMVQSPKPRLGVAKAAMAQSADFSGPALSAGKERVTITVSGEIALY